ncbi:MAG: hypothetical protein ABI840_09805 [bacterium]
MKTQKFKINVTLFLLSFCSIAFSQNDSTKIFKMKDFSISYIKGLANLYNDVTKKNNRVSLITTVEDITKLSFMNDTIISISTERSQSQQLNLDKITQLSIYRGSNTWKGIVIGAGAGAVLGFLVGVLSGSTEGTIWFTPEATGVLMGIVGIPLGAIIGGIVGANNPSFDTFTLGNVKQNKKDALIKILNSNKNKK